MISLKDLKNDILIYKKTNDKNVFYTIIANVDYLILYFIKRLRKQYAYIRQQEIVELYHTSIIALHNAISTFPEEMEERYIPCRIRAYMIAEFKKFFGYVDREYSLDSDHYFNTKRHTDIDINMMDYEVVMKSLTKIEAEIIDNYFQKKKSVKEIAKERNVTLGAVSKRVKFIVENIRH